jgi:hypothetical protein
LRYEKEEEEEEEVVAVVAMGAIASLFARRESSIPRFVGGNIKYILFYIVKWQCENNARAFFL